MTKPSPETIARALVDALDKKYQVSYSEIPFEEQVAAIAQAIQAERQRMMPSREEFTSWLSASVWVGIGRSPLEIYNWIESRMR